LAAPNAAFDAKLTYGGYQKANVEIPFQNFYLSGLNQIIAHRVSGSFHWSLPVIRASVRGVGFKPSVTNAMIDTGTTGIMMYYED